MTGRESKALKIFNPKIIYFLFPNCRIPLVIFGVVILLPLTSVIAQEKSPREEDRRRKIDWEAEYKKVDQKNLELEEKNRLLSEALREKAYKEFLLEKEMSASDRSESVLHEKSQLFLSIAKDERKEKQVLEKKQEWIRRSFYYPGVQRYENGEWGKGALWSVSLFGMLGGSLWATQNVFQARKALDSVPGWDLSGLEAGRARYDTAFQNANILFFLTGALYVLNIVDATYWVKPKPPESGSVRLEWRGENSPDTLHSPIPPLSLGNRSRTGWEGSTRLQITVFF